MAPCGDESLAGSVDEIGCDEWRSRGNLVLTATMAARRTENNSAKSGSVFEVSARCDDGILASHYDKLAYVDGTVIREANVDDAPGIARVHVESWRTTYRGIVPDAFLDGMSYEESERRWRERFGEGEGGMSFVAESPNGIVGFGVGGARRSESPIEYDGELYALYALAEARGMGIGRGLFGVVAERLSSLGYRSMLAWVMVENRSACGFYEAMGGTLLGNDTFEIEGVEIEEVAYGWGDVRGLVRASA